VEAGSKRHKEERTGVFIDAPVMFLRKLSVT